MTGASLVPVMVMVTSCVVEPPLPSFSFTVKVNDGNGGSTTQDVTITITGTNDAPVITSSAQTGNVSEGDPSHLLADMTATGQVTFTDADTSDAHTFTVSTVAAYGT